MIQSRAASAQTDSRTFAARLRRLAIAGTLVAAGALWALVAGDVVGVTARATSSTPQPAPAALQGNSPYYGASGGSGNGSYYGTANGGNGGFFGNAPNPGLGAAGNQAPLLGSGGS